MLEIYDNLESNKTKKKKKERKEKRFRLRKQDKNSVALFLFLKTLIVQIEIQELLHASLLSKDRDVFCFFVADPISI